MKTGQMWCQFLHIPSLMVKWWQRRQEAGCLTPRTYALSPKIPQNCKVIGGGHSIGQLWKDKKKKQEESGKGNEEIKDQQHPDPRQIPRGNCANGFNAMPSSCNEACRYNGCTICLRGWSTTTHYSISMMLVSADKEEQRATVQESSVMQAWDASLPTLWASLGHMSHNAALLFPKLAPAFVRVLTRAKSVMPAPAKAAMYRSKVIRYWKEMCFFYWCCCNFI